MKGSWNLEDVEPIIELVKDRFPDAVVCGSIRRGRTENIGDVDFVIPTSGFNIASFFYGVPDCVHLLTRKGLMLYSIREIQIKILNVSSMSQGAAQIALTGTPGFVRWMRARAKEQFMTLKPNGLYHNGILIASKTEELIFSALGLTFIPPEKREWTFYEARTFEQRRREDARSKLKENAVHSAGTEVVK